MTRSHVGKSILIVDDEELFREAVVEGAGLFNPSWACRGAAHGAVALELLLQEGADLVVTDLHMPVFDGFQLLAAIRQRRLTAPVIVVSAHVSPEIQAQVTQLGSLCLIEKPVRLPDLFACFERALGGVRSTVDGVTLAGFCQLLEIERHTCLLRAWLDERVADLVFRRGELIHVRLGNIVGRPAALEVLAWRQVHLEVLPAIDLENRTIEESLRWLLLEAARSLERGPAESGLQDDAEPRSALDLDAMPLSAPAGSAGLADLVAKGMDQALVVITANRGRLSYRVAMVNEAFTKLTGFAAGEIVGKTLAALRGPLTDPLLVSRIHADLAAGKDSRGRLVAYKKNRDCFEADLNIQAIRDASGRANYFFAVHRDISREEELRDREQRLRQTIEHINRPVVYLDLAGRVVDANSALAAWISAPVESVFGKPVWKLPGAPRLAEDLRWARTLLSQGKSWARQYETRLILGGVEVRRLVNANITRLLGTAGQVVGYVAIAQDVTEQTRLEQIAAAGNLNDTLGMVFASLRHELGNPINSLKAALEVIRFGQLSGEQFGRYHQLMQQQVERVEFMLGHMRSFGQFDRIDLRQIELAPLLGSVSGLLERVLEKNKCRLEWQVPPGLEVWADSHALVHVFVALLDNAAAAVAEQPDERRILRIEAHVSRESQVTIKVVDQGCGFPASERERIFAPFFSNRPGGSGLGLAIARRLITQMGGTISAHGEIGKGATFTLILDNRSRGRA